jgi:hypothetical protein
MCCGTDKIHQKQVKVPFADIENAHQLFQQYDSHEIRENNLIAVVRRKQWKCMIGLNLICLKIQTLAGLGDNISAAGWVYHNLRSPSH